MSSSREAVQEFLLDFRGIVTLHGLIFVDRKDVTKNFSSLGLTESLAREEILDLSVSDYSEGPLADHNNLEGHVWIFGKKIEGKETYIKLKIYGPTKQRRAKCMAFHEAKYPMSYPYPA
jgi:hypothetical protein